MQYSSPVTTKALEISKHPQLIKGTKKGEVSLSSSLTFYRQRFDWCGLAPTIRNSMKLMTKVRPLATESNNNKNDGEEELFHFLPQKGKGWKLMYRIMTIWYAFSVIYLHIYTPYNIVIAFMIKVDLDGKKLFVWALISTTATFDIILWKRKEMREFIWQLRVHCSKLSVERQRSICRYAVSGIFVTVLYILITFTYICVLTFAISIPETVLERDWMKQLCLNCNMSLLPTKHTVLIKMTDRSLYSLVVVGSWTVFPASYIVMCNTLKELICNFNDDIRGIGVELMTPITSGDVTKLRQRYHELRELIDFFNGIMTYLVFLWYGTTLVVSSQGMTLLLLNMKGADVNSILWQMVLYFQAIVDLLLVSVVASRVVEAAQDSQVLAQNLTRKAHEQSTDFYLEGILFLMELADPPLGLMAGKTFLITKKLCLSFFGAAVTYTIVTIQMNPKAMSSLS